MCERNTTWLSFQSIFCWSLHLNLFHSLFLVFLVSVGISAERLLFKRIACADNREILVTGKVKRAFFDKTGTLVSEYEFFDY